MKNKYYIVSYTMEYDGIYIYSHKVMTQKKYEIYELKWENIESTGFNTGYDTITIYKDDFDVLEISEQQYDTFEQLGFLNIGETGFYDPTSFIDPEDDL